MSINIKEIFQSDNLSTSQDKINYNFDQILANGGGPLGLKGDKGTTGAIGSIGPKGNKGENGGTGAKGSTGADGYWTLESYTIAGTPPDDQHTLLPKIQPTAGSGVGYKPTNLVLGVDDTSYTLDSIDKNALISLVNGTGSADWADLIRIRIKNVDDTFNDTSSIIRMIPDGGTTGAKLKIATTGGVDTLEISSSTLKLDVLGITKLKITSASSDAAGVWNFLAGSSINIAANGTSITLKNDGNSSLLGNNIIGATGKTNTITGTTTITGAEFRINPTGALPVLNKVLVAQDSNGKALWKNPTEVMGMYPIGSVIFVNPTEVRDTYFSISSYTAPVDSTSQYEFFGRGKSGTRWGGWYLLMGQTNAWYSGTTTLVSYVPTNIPGSILMGASAPDNTDLPGAAVLNDAFKSSMGTQGYNPPVGYGTSYQPSIRGTYTGVGSQGVVGPGSTTNPGDLLTRLPFAGAQGTYDYLDDSAILDGAIAMLDANTNVYDSPTFTPLPMAVYLGRTDLIYNYREPSSDYDDLPVSSGFSVSGLQTVTSTGSQQTVTGTITVSSQPITISFEASASASLITGDPITSESTLTFSGGSVTGGNISVTRSSGSFSGAVTRTLTTNATYNYTLTTVILTGSGGSASASFTAGSAI